MTSHLLTDLEDHAQAIGNALSLCFGTRNANVTIRCGYFLRCCGASEQVPKLRLCLGPELKLKGTYFIFVVQNKIVKIASRIYMLHWNTNKARRVTSEWRMVVGQPEPEKCILWHANGWFVMST